MVKVYVSLSMSLDGFITGPNPRPAEPMGDGGERLHEWMAGMADFRERGDTSNADADVLRVLSSRTGALLMGRTMFDAGEVPWGDAPPFGMPVFVLTHRPRETVTKQGGTTYTFVTDGLEAALEQAKAAAGGRTSGSLAAPTSPNSVSEPGSWTRFRSTSCPCCSAQARGCSTISAQSPSSWSVPAWWSRL
jgi:dihydrofolate reductase